MTDLAQREHIVGLIDEAVSDSASPTKASQMIGLSPSTVRLVGASAQTRRSKPVAGRRPHVQSLRINTRKKKSTECPEVAATEGISEATGLLLTIINFFIARRYKFERNKESFSLKAQAISAKVTLALRSALYFVPLSPLRQDSCTIFPETRNGAKWSNSCHAIH